MTDRRNWFERNWKWFVPLGCLTLLIAFVAVVGAFVYLLMSSIGSSEVAEIAVQHAVDHPRAQAALGTPIEKGWLISGEINVTNASGEAQLAIPLRGSTAAGTLVLKAEKTAGEWEYEMLAVEVEGTGERIDLLE